MRDAIGGTMTIYIIIVFLLLINGYLAFYVNYTKAFRVKNEIINIIEEQEGWTEAAKSNIEGYLDNINYTNIDSGFTDKFPEYVCENGYCVKAISTGTTADDTNRGTYYSVVTFINIDIPILKNFFTELPTLFSITGETKLIYNDNAQIE